MTTSVMTSNKNESSSFVHKYPLTIFFVLVLVLTCSFGVVDALGSHGILPFRLSIPLLLIQGHMPTLAAVIFVGMEQGREGIRALFRKLLIARVGFRWYLFAIFGMAVISIAAILLANQFDSLPAYPIIPTDAPTNPIVILVNAALLLVVSAVISGEELAWRGVALPRLQAKHNALVSSLILSVPWTLFHLPYFFTVDAPMSGMPFLSFAIRTVALTIVFTWMFNNTRGSVLLAYILHASANTWTQIFSIDQSYHFQDWMMTLILVALAVIVTVASGAENLSRTNTRVQE